MTENVTAGRDADAVDLTPEELARKERLKATTDAAEAGYATKQAAEDRAARTERAEQPVTIHQLTSLVEILRDRALGEDTTLGKVVELTELKRTLGAELDRVKKDLAPLNEAMLDELAAAGESSKRHAASGKLVYINPKIWARAATDKESACVALKEAGLGEFVAESFNTQSLSSYFRELAKEREAKGTPITEKLLDELLPAQLREEIALTIDRQVGVRS